MKNDIKQIGTKVYYCNITGNVLKVIGDMQGYVKETNFDYDHMVYNELSERSKDSIGCLTYAFGEFGSIVKNATGYSVDVETKQLVLTFEPLPEIPPEPTLEDKVTALEEQVKELVKANQEVLGALKTPATLDEKDVVVNG